MKSYTDIEKSRKLAEILPLDSADGYWFKGFPAQPYMVYTKGTPNPGEHIPCWSLAALLNVLPFPHLSKDKLGSGKVGWMVSVYPDNCRYDSCWNDNPIDACYEMVLKLNKLNLLV